jgi:hypothetical protein
MIEKEQLPAKKQTPQGRLFLSALRAHAMGHLGRSAVLADHQTLFLHGQMRPPPAHFPVSMMFDWYASHSGYSIGQ